MANLDPRRLRPTIGASMLGRTGGTIRERGFSDDDFTLADLGSSIDDQLTMIGQKVKEALRNGQITPQELGVEHLFVQETVQPISIGTGGQANVLAKLDFGFATTINGQPHVFAADTKTKTKLDDQSHTSQLYAQGKSVQSYFQDPGRPGADRYANAVVSIIQNNLLRVDNGSGQLTIVAKGMVDAAIQRASREANESAKVRIYAQLIKQLVIDPSIQAERNKGSAVVKGEQGQIVSQANRLNYTDPQVVTGANKAADYWHYRGRAIQRITGIASPDLVNRLRDTGGYVRRDFFSQEEYDAYKKSRTLMDTWSHDIATIEQSGGVVPQSTIDRYSSELRRTLTVKNQVLSFLPNMQNRQPVQQSGIYPSRLGVLNINEGWTQIAGTQMYVQGDRVRIASSKCDANGKPFVITELNYAKGVSGSHVINGRLVNGGTQELNEIAIKADQKWIQQTGGQQGQYAAVNEVRGLLNKKVVAPLPGSATVAWEYKYGTALPDDPNVARKSIQERVKNLINSGVFPGVYDEEGIMADLAKLIPSVPGMAVFTDPVTGKPVARTGREGKTIKDIQKNARNYALRYAGRETMSPLIAQGADRPEAVTVLNKVLLSNLKEFSTLRSDLAAGFVGTTPYRERIPVSDSSNFIKASPEQIKFGKDASGRNGLMVGWDIQPDGSRHEHYYRVNNWDDITGITAKLVERKDGSHFVVEGTAHQGILSGGTKSWNQKAMWVSGETGASPDIEATAYYNAGNPLLTAVAITNGMYATRPDMIATDILKMVRDRKDVRDVLAKRNNLTPDQIEQVLSTEMQSGKGGEFVVGASRLAHDAWMLLIDQKSTELTGVHTVSERMSKQRFDALRMSLGVSSKPGEVGVVLPDRFSDVPNSDSFAFRDKRGNTVISDQEMAKIDVRIRGYVGPMADVFTTSWQWGRGKMSMEEMQDVLKNPNGYPQEVRDSLIANFLPQALRSGGRAREGHANLVKAYLANTIDGVDQKGLGINTITFDELQKRMGENVAVDFYSQINDPANDFIGKFIMLPNGKIAPPLRTHYGMSTFREGAKAGYTNKVTGRSIGRSEQLNRIPKLLKDMLAGQIDSVDFENNQKEYADLIHDLSIARGTIKNSLSTRYGIEGVYVMDPNLPFNAIVIDDETADRAFGTRNREEIARKARYMMGLRRPDSSSGLSGMMALKVYRPEEVGRDPRQRGMFVSNLIADVYQGDTDGDRMAAFAANVIRTGDSFAGMEKAVSKEGFLGRVSYGFSAILGTPIHFKTLSEYQKFAFELKKAGVGSSELGKNIANLKEDMMGDSPLRKLVKNNGPLLPVGDTTKTEEYLMKSGMTRFPLGGESDKYYDYSDAKRVAALSGGKLLVSSDFATIVGDGWYLDLGGVGESDPSRSWKHGNHMIYVSPENRKKGIATTLLKIMMNVAGGSFSTVPVTTEGNRLLERVGPGLGFKKDPNFDDSGITHLTSTQIPSLSSGDMRSETLEEMLNRATVERSLEDVSKGTMQTEAVGKREMELGYSLFKWKMPAVLNKLGIVQDKQYEQRTRYHVYQKAVDKIIFSSGLRENISLMSGFNFGTGIATDQLSPNLGEQPQRRVNPGEKGGSISFARAIIQGVLKEHEFRANGSNVSWLRDTARAITNDTGQQQMIMAIIAGDSTLKDEIAKTEAMGGGTEGILNRARHYQAMGKEGNLDALMEQRASDLAKLISKSVFGDSLRSVALSKGAVSSMAMAMAAAQTKRATTWGGPIGSKASYQLSSLEHELGSDLLESFISAGEVGQAEAGITGGRAAEQLASDVLITDKLGDRSSLFSKLLGLGVRGIRDAKHKKDQTKKRFFRAQDGVGDTVDAKINIFEDQLLSKMRQSDLPTSQWIKFVTDVSNELGVDSGNMILFDKKREGRINPKTNREESGFLSGPGRSFGDVSPRLFAEMNTPVNKLAPDLQEALTRAIGGAFEASLKYTGSTSRGITGLSSSVAAARQTAFASSIPDDMSGTTHEQVALGALRKSMGQTPSDSTSTPVDDLTPRQRAQARVRNAGMPPSVDPNQVQKRTKVYTVDASGKETLTWQGESSGRKIAQDKYGTAVNALGTQEGQAFFGQYTSGQRPMAELHQGILGQGVNISGQQYSITESLVKSIDAASKSKLGGTVGTTAQDLVKNGLVDSAGGLFNLAETAQSVKVFGESLKTGVRHVEGYGKTLQDMRTSLLSGEKLTGTEKIRADWNVAEMKPLAKQMGTSPENIEEFERMALGAGLSGQETGRLISQLREYQTVSQAEGDDLSLGGTGARKGPSGGGVGGKVIRGLTSGDLGQLGWTMMNARRIWSMTGGAVSGRLSDYAKYSAEQQSALTGLGLQDQYTGAGADVIRQQNNLTDFERGNQRAAWNTFSPIFNGISDVFGGSNPSHPGFMNYAANAVPLGVGLPIMAGFGATLMGMSGIPALGTVAGIGGATASAGLAGGLAAGAGAILPYAAVTAVVVSALQAMGEPIREGQNFGMAIEEKTADLSHSLRQGLGLEQKQTDEEYQKSKQGKWWYGKGGDIANIGDVVATETQNQVSRELATNIASMISKTIGISAEQLNTTKGRQFISQLGQYPDQEGMATRFDLGQQIGRMGGLKYGSVGFENVISQTTSKDFSNEDVLKAKANLDKFSAFSDMARTLGNQDISWLINPSMMANATSSMKLQYSKLGGQDRREWSRVGREQGSSDLITMERDSNLPLGTLTTDEFSEEARYDARISLGYHPQAFLPLQSLASIASQQRAERDKQQQFQFAQQQRNLDLNRAQVFGGGFTQDGTTSTFTGSMNIQQAQADLSLRSGLAGLALSGGTLGQGYGWKGFNLQQLQGSSLDELGTAGLNYRQALEGMALQKKQSNLSRDYSAEDAQISWQRGTTQNQWQGQDLQTSFSRSMIQFGQQMQDLSTNFGRSQQGFQWQQQGLSLRGSQQSTQFGWNMEDIDENMRFATGRQRRLLSRQRERTTIGFGFQESGLNLQQEQLKKREEWSAEDFAKDQTRLEERRGWAEADFAKDKERLTVKQSWLDEDLARTLGRIGTQRGLEDEEFALRLKNLTDELTLSAKGHAQSMADLLASNKLSQQSRDDAKKGYEVEFANQQKVLDNNKNNTLLMTQLGDSYDLTTATMKTAVDNFTYNFGALDGPVQKAIGQMKDGFLKAIEDVLKGMGIKVEDVLKDFLAP